MGLTRLPLRTFYWVSQVGMLPSTFLFVNAGVQLARVGSVADLLSPGLVLSLVLLGLFPLAARRLAAARCWPGSAGPADRRRTGLPFRNKLLQWQPRRHGMVTRKPEGDCLP
jgi:hypothetical protein